MRIRPFEPQDATAVASLWQYWFRGKSRVPDPGLVELVSRIYENHPHAEREITPLVAEDASGKMLGFLGVTVMPVLVDGEERKIAGVFPSVVDPEAPTTVAAFLLRKFLSGPQAMTFSDGGHVKFEAIWELLGGQIAPLQSLRWVKLFRPSELLVSTLPSRKGIAPLLPALSFLARGGDVVARGLVKSRLVSPDNAYTSETMTPSQFAQIATQLLSDRRLWPKYDAAFAAWQLNEMASIKEQGEFRVRIVRTEGHAVGWYIYYLKRGGVGRVFDLEAKPKHLSGVIGRLFAEADGDGAGALIGRMEPRLRRPMNQHAALVHNGGSLQMIHSKDQSLVDDALLGRLAFSRLQGENWYWWAINSQSIPLARTALTP